MITIVKNTELGLETLDALTVGSWANVIDPTPEEVAHLQQELDVPADFVTYPLDMDGMRRWYMSATWKMLSILVNRY